MRALTLSLFVLLGCSLTFAQSNTAKFEISPFVGYETGASAPVQTQIDPNTGLPISNIDRVGIEKSLSYGAFLDWQKWQAVALEFMWARNPSSYTQHDFVAGQSFKAYNSTVDQYQFGALFPILGAERKFSPFIAAGLGFTHSNNSNNSGDTAFAWNAGGGLKYNLSRHFALRADARLLSTYASTIQGQVCDPFYGCYTASQRNYFKRFNTSAGVTFRF